MPPLFFQNTKRCGLYHGCTDKKKGVISMKYGYWTAKDRLRIMEQSVNGDLWRKSGFAIRGFEKILKDHSDFERLSLLFQMIAQEAQYDYTYKRRFRSSFVGALRDRNAVCAGFSELMVYLVSALTDYEIFYVRGKVHGSQDFHAWNIIVIDGEGYMLDVTWALKNSAPKYFLRSETEVALKKRDWDRDSLPACRKNYTTEDKKQEVMYQNQETLDRLCAYFRKLESAFNKTGDFAVDAV